MRQHRARRALDSQNATHFARVLRTALAVMKVEVPHTASSHPGLAVRTFVLRIAWIGVWLVLVGAALLSLLSSQSRFVNTVIGIPIGLGVAIYFASSVYLIRNRCPVCGEPFVKRTYFRQILSLDNLLAVTCQHCRSSLLT